jgi:hypothetical protein
MTSTLDPGKRFYRQLAQHAGLEFVTFDGEEEHAGERRVINPLAARLLSEQIARHFTMLPISYANGTVTIATASPADEVARDVAVSLTGRDVRFVVAPKDELQHAIDATFSGWAGIDGVADPDATAVDGDLVGSDAHAVTSPSFPTRLGDLLVARGIATDAEIALALEEQDRTGSRLGDILVANSVISESELIAILAEQFQLPLIDLSEYEPDPAALELIPEPLGRPQRAGPIAVVGTSR